MRISATWLLTSTSYVLQLCLPKPRIASSVAVETRSYFFNEFRYPFYDVCPGQLTLLTIPADAAIALLQICYRPHVALYEKQPSSVQSIMGATDNLRSGEMVFFTPLSPATPGCSCLTSFIWIDMTAARACRRASWHPAPRRRLLEKGPSLYVTPSGPTDARVRHADVKWLKIRPQKTFSNIFQKKFNAVRQSVVLYL
jgi:hypothetical protein